MKIRFLMVAGLLAVCSGNAQAKPGEGFGISFGGAANYMTSTYTVGSLANPVGSVVNYSSSGGSFGMDYQMVFPNNLTLNPFVTLSSESTDRAGQTGSTLGHSVLGLQGRYWTGDLFVGVHGALYTETTTSSTGTSTASETGNGQGLVVGWEPSKSGWSIMLQGDSATFKYPDQDVTMTSARLSIGYRWK